MAMLARDELVKRFNQRAATTGMAGYQKDDSLFNAVAKKYNYGGQDVDESQANAAMDEYFGPERTGAATTGLATGGVETVPISGAPAGPAMSGLSSAFSGGGGGGGRSTVEMPMPIVDQGQSSPTNPALGARNLPIQGLRLAMIQGRIY